MSGSATTAPIDVYLDEVYVYGGQGYYRVVVDGKNYNDFVCRPPLTFSQQIDVQTYYRESLTYWSLPDSV